MSIGSGASHGHGQAELDHAAWVPAVDAGVACPGRVLRLAVGPPLPPALAARLPGSRAVAGNRDRCVDRRGVGVLGAARLRCDCRLCIELRRHRLGRLVAVRALTADRGRGWAGCAAWAAAGGRGFGGCEFVGSEPPAGLWPVTSSDGGPETGSCGHGRRRKPKNTAARNGSGIEDSGTRRAGCAASQWRFWLSTGRVRHRRTVRPTGPRLIRCT